MNLGEALGMGEDEDERQDPLNPMESFLQAVVDAEQYFNRRDEEEPPEGEEPYDHGIFTEKMNNVLILGEAARKEFGG